MILVLAGGDSIIWGSELSDYQHCGPGGFSRKTFTALCSDNYFCSAYPGIGNKEISTRIQSSLNLVKPDIVIVCWTWPSRDNVHDSDKDISKLESILKEKCILYLFTCVDNCVVTGNLDYTNWFLFPPGKGINQTEHPRGFYQWAVESGYNCGKDSHPLDEAHQDAYNLIKVKFDELVKKSLV